MTDVEGTWGSARLGVERKGVVEREIGASAVLFCGSAVVGMK
jgi:hypothetical protein